MTGPVVMTGFFYATTVSHSHNWLEIGIQWLEIGIQFLNLQIQQFLIKVLTIKREYPVERLPIKNI